MGCIWGSRSPPHNFLGPITFGTRLRPDPPPQSTDLGSLVPPQPTDLGSQAWSPPPPALLLDHQAASGKGGAGGPAALAHAAPAGVATFTCVQNWVLPTTCKLGGLQCTHHVVRCSLLSVSKMLPPLRPSSPFTQPQVTSGPHSVSLTPPPPDTFCPWSPL